jgi:ABC-2 type transport system ATP-binding protein
LLPGIHDLESSEGRVRFVVDGEHLDTAVKHVSGFGLNALTSHPPTLEELMLRHYGNELTGAGHGGNGNGVGR